MNFRRLAIWDKIRQTRSRIASAFTDAVHRKERSEDLPAKPAGGSFRKKAAIAAKILSFLITLFFIATSILLLYALVLGKDDQGNVSLGPYEVMTVLTGSMEPEIAAGDMVIMKKGNPARVRVGDIITFYPYEGSYSRITHRVVSIEDQGFITRGDANQDADRNLVTPFTYIGKVVVTAPLAGKLLTRPTGLIFLAGLFLLYAIGEAALKERLGRGSEPETAGEAEPPEASLPEEPAEIIEDVASEIPEETDPFIDDLFPDWEDETFLPAWYRDSVFGEPRPTADRKARTRASVRPVALEKETWERPLRVSRSPNIILAAGGRKDGKSS